MDRVTQDGLKQGLLISLVVGGIFLIFLSDHFAMLRQKDREMDQNAMVKLMEEQELSLYTKEQRDRGVLQDRLKERSSKAALITLMRYRRGLIDSEIARKLPKDPSDAAIRRILEQNAKRIANADAEISRVERMSVGEASGNLLQIIKSGSFSKEEAALLGIKAVK